MPTSITHAGYALTPHRAAFWPDQAPVSTAEPINRFLVIDAGQAPNLAAPLRKLHPPERCASLYEGTFADNVSDLSPLVVELSAERPQALKELSHLDRLCAAWPIMSLVQTPLPLPQWLQHLRALLRIQMDGTDYLWRLADTQVLQATAHLLTTEQRAQVLGPCQSWWLVSAAGELHDVAAGLPHAPLASTASLQLSAAQERALLDATAAHALRSQLRALDIDFSTRLTHAEQSLFAQACVDEARASLMDEDSELLPWALSTWQTQASGAPTWPNPTTP